MGSRDGAPEAHSSEKPVHRVTITKPFYMATWAVSKLRRCNRSS
ncbi:hypothetical protein [Variovorax sp. YR266]|nr:hypothetical protein [Variovorax sp. YR266]